MKKKALALSILMTLSCGSVAMAELAYPVPPSAYQETAISWAWVNSNEYQTVEREESSYAEEQNTIGGVIKKIVASSSLARAKLNIYGAKNAVAEFGAAVTPQEGMYITFHAKAVYDTDMLTLTERKLCLSDGTVVGELNEPLIIHAIEPNAPYHALYIALACKAAGTTPELMEGTASLISVAGLSANLPSTHVGSSTLSIDVASGDGFVTYYYSQNGSIVTISGNTQQVLPGSAEQQLYSTALAYSQKYKKWAHRMTE